MEKPKLVITKVKGQVTGVYLDPNMIGQLEIEDLNYDFTLSESDEAIENLIDNNQLIKIQ
jgi:hypothetical protein